MWLQILAIILPALFEFLAPFIRKLEASNANDAAFLEAAYAIVEGMGADASLATNEDKRTAAFTAIQALGVDLAKPLKDAQINALIELAVQRLKATGANA